MNISLAEPSDELSITRLLDSALLDVDDVLERIKSESVLKATRENNRMVGVLIFETLEEWNRGNSCDIQVNNEEECVHIVAIAVRKRMRGQGVGTELIEALMQTVPVISASFHERSKPFYNTLGFEIYQCGESRYTGVLSQ